MSGFNLPPGVTPGDVEYDANGDGLCEGCGYPVAEGEVLCDECLDLIEEDDPFDDDEEEPR